MKITHWRLYLPAAVLRVLPFSFLTVLFILAATLETYAQQKFTISGTIEDAASGEELIGASVSIKELATGGVTNEYGFYSLTVPQGSYTLVVSYVGYQSQSRVILLENDTSLLFPLERASATLKEVVISSAQKDQNVQSTQMSVNRLEMREIETIPVVFGERDVVKTIQLLPGIKSSEGGGGFFVRGGSADQNLILLDEAPVYNASHLLGFFSVFNSDAIKDLQIYKGYIPSEYGGRASSVLDIRMNDGNNKKFNLGGGIGLISSRLTAEAPIVKDKGSVIISGRRTYLDLFLKLSSDEDLNKSILYFYDLNAKANYRFGEKDRLFVSAYLGRDKFGFGDDFGFDWGNTTSTLRWNHLFSSRLFSNSTFLFSDYNYDVEIGGDENKSDGLTISSAIQDISLKQDFEYYLSTANTLKFGVSGIYHTFLPGQINPEENSNINAIELQEKYAWEAAAYGSSDMTLTDKLKLNLGLRYSWFAQVGPGTIYTYDSEGDVSGTDTYDAGEIVETYGGLEPRTGLTYLLNEVSSLKASYGRNRQYLHLVSNSTSGTPIDLWIPSSNNVKPQIADQYALGYFRNFNDNAYEGSVEIYYKDMQNQVDYRTGADLIFNENVESQLLFGKGWSYGAEFYLKKNIGNFSGWISYTWSKTERRFDDIDYGNAYPANWDRTHDLSIVGVYKMNPKWTLSSTFVYRTGDATTYPIGKYHVDGEVISRYGQRNENRLPDYHRLDLGATLQLRNDNKFESSLNFSVYNVYGRKNAFAINFQEAKDDPSRTEAVKISLFSILPSVTYNFKFK
ncbi:TonB-dependent receptor domain-containing protein [Pontibacter silvestris]|uniref:TonB-dependent receptor domain-containing protein n=1 Tax=Pontibacter silvestris TaxID=2305183 RepID=A0ABW4WSR3_9BACT|nr:TonB-dependent receptor [Pontibacter silvestris]MCC9138417.1 TonB-dependent receptor [Pontibacter silvestris]